MECIVRFCVVKPKNHPFSFLLVLKWRMAPHCAAAPPTRRRPQVLVWSCIPTRQGMASAASPSCTALTATTTCRPSPCLEIPPFLGNCKSNASWSMFPHWDCAQQTYSVSLQAWRGLDSHSICTGKNSSIGHISAETRQFFLTPSGQSSHWSRFLHNYPSIYFRYLLLP